MMDSEELRQLEAFTGPRLHALLSSSAAAEASLIDSDPLVRFGALILMTYHWEPSTAFKEKCTQMARNDPDNRVRSTAFSCLSRCFEGTHDPKVEQFLVGIIRDESRVAVDRRDAYIALIFVSGRPECMTQSHLLGNLKIPEDVDWTFVKSFEPGRSSA